MKPLSKLALLMVGIVPLVGAPVLAEAPDYDAIADNLVNQSLAVQPGETVVIGGGPSEIDRGPGSFRRRPGRALGRFSTGGRTARTSLQ
jgi:hypothetical protein